MKRRIRSGALLLSFFILVVMMPNEAHAASANVSVSSTSGNVGSTVTVTCTASMSGADIGGTDVILEYDPSSLSVVSCSSGANGGSGSVYFSQNATGAGQSSLSFTVSFKILREGTHNVSVSGSAEVFDWETGASVSPSRSGGSVTGNAQTTNNNTGNNNNNTGGSNNGNTNSNNNTPVDNNNTAAEEKDGNSKLNSLQVNPGTLSPAFAPDTTSYTVTVPGDTTEVTIAAAAQSNKAAVSVSGGKDLKLGENEAKVVVTAENGSITVYQITILCGEKEKIQVDGKTHTINESFPDEQIPAGFVREKVTYGERQYEALKHEKGELYLVSLQNDETGAAFYIYDQKTQEFYHYVRIDFFTGRYIIPLPLDDTKEFEECEIISLSFWDKQIDAWKLDEEYSVIRVMDSDGKIVLYRYDNLDGTLQRYKEPDIEIAEEEPEKEENTEKTFLDKNYRYIIIGLGALALIMLITLIYFIVTTKFNPQSVKHRQQIRKHRLQKKLEKKKEKESINNSEE